MENEKEKQSMKVPSSRIAKRSMECFLSSNVLLNLFELRTSVEVSPLVRCLDLHSKGRS